MEITPTAPLSAVRGATGNHIHDDSFVPFWAQITANSGGAYSWTEQLPQAGGTFIALPGGRSGTATVNPAYEESGNTQVPVNKYVQLNLGFFNQNSVGQEYLFNYCCTS
jgi:hypothetical protein